MADTEIPTKIGGVDVMDLGVEEQWGASGIKATRKVRCNWADRFTVMKVLNPGATNVGGVYAYSASPYPNNPALFPQDFRCRGEGIISRDEVTGMVQYSRCLLQIDYSTFRGGSPQGFIELDVGTNVVTLGHAAQLLETVNADGHDPIPVSPLIHQGITLTVLNLCRGRNNVAGLPIDTILAAAENPINQSVFMGRFKPGTVIFNGGRAMRQTTTNTGSGIDGSGVDYTDGAGNSSGTGPGNGNVAAGTAALLQGAWNVEYQFIIRPKLPWDFLPRWKDKSGNGTVEFDGFALARFVGNQGDYIGRSDLDKLFN